MECYLGLLLLAFSTSKSCFLFMRNTEGSGLSQVGAEPEVGKCCQVGGQ